MSGEEIRELNATITSLIESIRNSSKSIMNVENNIMGQCDHILNMPIVSAHLQNKEADKKETNASKSVMPQSKQKSDFLENTQSKVDLYFRDDVSQNQSSKQDFEQKMPGVSAPVAVTVQPAQVAVDVVRAEKVQKLAMCMHKSNRID